MNRAMEISQDSSRPLPVLMIPLRRCGSHAIRLRLNFNTKFYSPYPLHIVDFAPLIPLYGDLSNDEAYFQMVVDIIGLQAINVVKWQGVNFDPIEIFEAIAQEHRSAHRVVWELLLRAGEAHNACVVMDKSLDSVHYAQELLALFPNMRFLNVVRDPRAQVASMNRAIIHDFDTLLNATAWRDAHRAARFLISAFPDRVLTIRYEDFLRQQDGTLRAVCEFFGIEFLPEMLDIGKSQEAIDISRRSTLWESNHYPPIMTNVEKFKTQLTMEEIRIIETLTQEYMTLYGYDFMTDARAEITPGLYIANKERSATRREQVWRDLQKTNPRDYILRRARANYLQMIRSNLAANSRVPAPDGVMRNPIHAYDIPGASKSTINRTS